MKLKNLFLIGSFVVLLSACKSTESSYKQAYEKAVQQDVAQSEQNGPVDVTPVKAAESQSATEDPSSVSVREEKVTIVSGDSELKAYGVVCGSFSLKSNAEELRKRLTQDGYPALVVVNEAGKTFRVVLQSFNTKEEAVTARSNFKAKYPDNSDFQASWILYKK